jgi:hypothetical protein
MGSNSSIDNASGCVGLTSCHTYNLRISSLNFIHMGMSLDRSTPAHGGW